MPKVFEQDLSDALSKQDALNKTVLGLEKQLELLTDKGKQARTIFEEAKAVYEQAVIQDQAAVLREHLHQGDKCPVCEQLILALPASQKSQVATLKQQQEDLAQQLKDLQEQYAEVKANLSAHKQRLLEQQQQLEVLRSKVEEAKHILGKRLQEFSGFGQDVKSIAPVLLETKQSLLAALAASIMAQTDGVDISQMQQKLQQEKRDITEKLKSAEVNFHQLERSTDKLQTELMSLKSQLEQSLQEQVQLQSSLEASLAKAGFDSIQSVKQAALSSDEIKRLELKLNSYASQKESFERREVELQAKLSGAA